MLRVSILVQAGLLYLIALGCVLAPAKSPAKDGDKPAARAHVVRGGAPMTGLPFKSVTMQLQRTDWMDRYEKNIDEIAALGADTVQFVVDPRMENGTRNRIYLDLRTTPTVEQLSRLIKHAKSRKLRVTLMPIVLLDDPRGNEWRGTLKPDLWEQWFSSYREIMRHYAWVAQENGVDLLVVGSELVSSENKLNEWTRTINAIREIYKGKLTYSSNWDHYTSVPFWDQLDMIGMNSYWKFSKSASHNPTVDEIVARWREIQKDLFEFQAKAGKPIMFLEIGWFSQKNVAWEPWDYTQEDQPIDLDLQRKLYEGFFTAWWGDPRLGGFSVWEWPPDAGGREDRGYTPKGKPAEAVLREWFARPWSAAAGQK